MGRWVLSPWFPAFTAELLLLFGVVMLASAQQIGTLFVIAAMAFAAEAGVWRIIAGGFGSAYRTGTTRFWVNSYSPESLFTRVLLFMICLNGLYLTRLAKFDSWLVPTFGLLLTSIWASAAARAYGKAARDYAASQHLHLTKEQVRKELAAVRLAADLVGEDAEAEPTHGSADSLRTLHDLDVDFKAGWRPRTPPPTIGMQLSDLLCAVLPGWTISMTACLWIAGIILLLLVIPYLLPHLG